MKKFLLRYIFDGNGTVEIEAETIEEATELFYKGDFDNEDEHEQNYEVINHDVIVLKSKLTSEGR